jgi:transcriptional regulator with GAF, ATPase, and Fis domain
MSMTNNIQFLKEYSSNLLTASFKSQILKLLAEAITSSVGTKQLIIVTCDAEKRCATLEVICGLEGLEIKPPMIQWTNDINHWLNQGAEILSLKENEADKFLILLEPKENQIFQCEIRIPLFIHKNFFGVVSLGSKEYGTEYTTDDIDLLHVLLNLSTLTLERLTLLPSHSQSAATPASEKSATETRLSLQQPQIRLNRINRFGEILGKSPAMSGILDLIDRVAPKDVTILITGESGTGKELVAQRIHRQSQRSINPLITMNCAALPDHLVESELFGHEKGAFTNAYTQKKGRFEIANGSSLFLDEIGEMSQETQAKLLRVLQDGTFQRIGGTKTLQSDVRIIAATNKNLEEEIERGKFRHDLYYRLNVVQIHLPSLRERKEDILLLAGHFIHIFCESYHKQIFHLTDGAKQKLITYPFPGNIRELQNIIERAVIMEKSERLTLDFLQLPTVRPSSSYPVDASEKNTLGELEKQHIEEILKSVYFNKSRAAKILGIARKTLREKIQRYCIQTPQ